MIYHDDEQGSQAWLSSRLAVLTASRSKALITKTGQVSKGSGVQTLARQLVFEALTHEPATDFYSETTERGTREEPNARVWLASEIDAEIEQFGLITTDSGRVGCSVDGAIDRRIGVELKCPLAANQVRYAEDIAALHSDYQHQLEVGFWVTKWEEWVIASYAPSPAIPSVYGRFAPDPQYQAALDEAIPAVLKRVDEIVADFRERTGADDNPFIF